MKIFDSLKRTVDLLASYEGHWAICGGVAACLYRETPRYTGDIDIALSEKPNRVAADTARDIVSALGYDPVVGHVTDQHGTLIKETALVLGRENDSAGFLGIDFLLPVLPWIQPAVERAQKNKLDYGFARIPTLTPEDLIVAKLFALTGTPERKQDLDDIESILRQMNPLDANFIRNQARAFELTIPGTVAGLLLEN